MKNISLILQISFVISAFVGNASYAATECMNAANTVAIGDCFSKEQAKAEELLNETYEHLIYLAEEKKLDELENDLRRAERVWIEFRKLNCAFHGGMERTRNNFKYLDCMLRMTRERESEIDAAYKELARW